jgi:hypothetical protein
MKKASRPKTSASKRPDRNLRLQRATAQNLANGMTVEKAMLVAGYSPSYAHDQGYKAVKRPCIQSVFTDSCKRIMAKRHLQFDELVEPYFDALKAPLIVKSTQLGDAYKPIDHETQKPFPDHALRMDAADRIVELFGGKLIDKEIGSPPAPPLGHYGWEGFSLEERLSLQAELTAVIQRRLRERGQPILVSGNGHAGNGSTT